MTDLFESFDRFMPSSWAVRGLVSRDDVEKRNAPAPRMSARKAVMCFTAMTAFGLAAGMSQAATAQTAIVSGVPSVQTEEVAADFDDVPINFWPNLIQFMKTLPVIPESDSDEFEPAF